uniref:Polyprotein n=1 Tax=Kibale red colobus virus 1 TaxID=1885929 RepID=A0A1L5YNJ4_9NIDO|nr:polyprotein [Kibale red colobus virus 1]
MICTCSNDNFVVRIAGEYVCVRCTHTRPEHPIRRGSSRELEPYIRYLSPEVAAIYAQVPGECWLEFVGALVNALDAWTKPGLAESYVREIVAAGALTPDYVRLQTELVSAIWVECYGPVAGAICYASPNHISVPFFPAARLALVRRCTYRGLARIVPFPEWHVGSDVYHFNGNTFYETEDTVMWKRGVTPGTAPAPADRVDFAVRVRFTIPECFLAYKSWLGREIGSGTLNEPEGSLAFENGTCWAELFPDVRSELSIARTFGYQLPWGAQGGYIMRRVAINGLKLVKNPEGQRIAYTFHAGSWLGHIGWASDPLPEGAAVVSRFDVVHFNAISPYPAFRLPKRVYFGGNSVSSVPYIPEDPKFADFLQPGFCWVLLFPPYMRKEEVKRAVLAGQLSSCGVPGSYLKHRLTARLLTAVVDPYGSWFVTARPGDDFQRHVSVLPPGPDEVELGRISVVPINSSSPDFNFGFGYRYGKRKGGKKLQPITFGAAPDVTVPDVTGSEVSPSPEQPAPQPAPAPENDSAASPPPVTRPVPKPRTKVGLKPLNIPTPQVREAATALPPTLGPSKASQVAAPTYGGLRVVAPNVERCTKVHGNVNSGERLADVPSDGGCGVHVINQLLSHIKGLTPIYPKMQWAYAQWLDNDQMGQVLCSLKLPVGQGTCTHCQYVVNIVDQHWELRYHKDRAFVHSPLCAHGICHTVVGPIECVENPRYVDISGLLEFSDKFSSGTEFVKLASALGESGHCRRVSPRRKWYLELLGRKSATDVPFVESPGSSASPPAEGPAILSVSTSTTTTNSDSASNVPTERGACSNQQAEESVGTAPMDDSGTIPVRLKDRIKHWTFDVYVDVSRQVSHLRPHLLHFLHGSNRAVHPGTYTAALLFMCICMLLCLHAQFIGIALLAVPLYLCHARQSIRVLSLFAVFLYVAALFLSDEHHLCAVDDNQCLQFLHSLQQRFSTNPPRFLTPGPITTGAVFVNYFWGAVVLGYFLYYLGFLLDIGLVGLVAGYNRICWRCLRPCIRTAPEELVLLTVPASRIHRATVLDVCDNYSSPPVDIVKQATGYAGCYKGQLPSVASVCCNVPAAKVDVKKVSAKTVCSIPTSPSEAVKALQVLNARGQLGYENHSVEAVTVLPCANPFFPYDTSSSKIVTVCAFTYNLFTELGIDTSLLTIGDGDFFKAMGVEKPKSFCLAALRKRVGGKKAALLAALAWVLFWVLLGAFLQSPVACGYGTNDRFCVNVYGVPVVGNHGVCAYGYCASPQGVLHQGILNVPLSSITLPVIVFLTVIFAVFWKFHLLGYVYSVLPFFLPNLPLVVPLRVLICIAGSLRVPLQFNINHLAATFYMDPAGGVLTAVIAASAWALGRFTGVGGLVTPYDIHRVVKSSRDAVALANAPHGTYLAAVRDAALSGNNKLFLSNSIGYMLEGALRTGTPATNTRRICGEKVGVCGVFQRGVDHIIITASHVLGNGDVGVVEIEGQRREVTFKKTGDFAVGNITGLKGAYPTYREAPNHIGRAYWLCANGVESGFVGTDGCVVYTGPGDSGSPVVTPSGDLIGIHTGSDTFGCGAISKSDGHVIVGPVKLSEMARYYAGPLQKTPTKMPRNVVGDCENVPLTLARVIADSVKPEGKLGTIQLVVASMVLWRLCVTPLAVPLVIAFFVVNEIAPRSIVRGAYGFILFALSMLPGFGPKILLIRALTAALNRNQTSLAFHLGTAVIAFLNDWLVSGDHIFALHECSFYVFGYNQDKFVVLAIGGVVFLTAAVLEAFGYEKVSLLLSGNGSFDPAFFVRYVQEGVREGVASTIATESLSGALAVNLSAEELEFLNAIVPCKAFASASNLSKAMGDFQQSQAAKQLRRALAGVQATANTTAALATLDQFLSTKVRGPRTGDTVVYLGKPRGEIFDGYVGETQVILKPVRTQSVAGVTCTICEVTVPTEAMSKHPVPEDAVTPIALENDARKLSRQDRDREEIKRDSEKIGVVTVSGKQYTKFWDKVTGDVWYSDEAAFPESPAQAAMALNVSTDLTTAEKERLSQLIQKLAKLRSEEALNS